MSSTDSPNPRFIKTFSLDVEVDPALLEWLDEQAALLGYTTVITQALYDAMKTDAARRALPPPPPEPEDVDLPGDLEIARSLGALRSCLKLVGFWPDKTYRNDRSDAETRMEIISQVNIMTTIPLLVMMFISSIFTLARLKGVSYE